MEGYAYVYVDRYVEKNTEMNCKMKVVEMFPVNYNKLVNVFHEQCPID